MSPHVPARELLLHPASLVALGLLVFNDHWLKHQHPGVVSGKLSDAAGLVVFPLLLVVACESLAQLVGRPAPRPSTSVVGSALLVALVFALVKTFPMATDAYRHALGYVQWPLHAAWSIVRGAPIAAPAPVLAVTDPTDLVALPFLAVAVWIARGRRAVRTGFRALRASARLHDIPE